MRKDFQIIEVRCGNRFRIAWGMRATLRACMGLLAMVGGMALAPGPVLAAGADPLPPRMGMNSEAILDHCEREWLKYDNIVKESGMGSVLNPVPCLFREAGALAEGLGAGSNRGALDNALLQLKRLVIGITHTIVGPNHRCSGEDGFRDCVVHEQVYPMVLLDALLQLRRGNKDAVPYTPKRRIPPTARPTKPEDSSEPPLVLSRPSSERMEELLGMEFVRVPGGCFQMGCQVGQSDCDPDERPSHEVCVDSFEIGKHEITENQFKFYALNYYVEYYFHFPLIQEASANSREDVKFFLERINRLGTTQYRLPTEAEWEYACRGGGRSERYCGGDDLEQVGWVENGSIMPVGLKAPNAFGLFDLSGNVWEWVQDSYRGDYYAQSPRHNPTGPASSIHKVRRGGSAYSHSRYMRSTYRSRASLLMDQDHAGFRLVHLRPAGEPGASPPPFQQSGLGSDYTGDMAKRRPHLAADHEEPRKADYLLHCLVQVEERHGRPSGGMRGAWAEQIKLCLHQKLTLLRTSFGANQLSGLREMIESIVLRVLVGPKDFAAVYRRCLPPSDPSSNPNGSSHVQRWHEPFRACMREAWQEYGGLALDGLLKQKIANEMEGWLTWFGKREAGEITPRRNQEAKSYITQCELEGDRQANRKAKPLLWRRTVDACLHKRLQELIVYTVWSEERRFFQALLTDMLAQVDKVFSLLRPRQAARAQAAAVKGEILELLVESLCNRNSYYGNFRMDKFIGPWRELP